MADLRVMKDVVTDEPFYPYTAKQAVLDENGDNALDEVSGAVIYTSKRLSKTGFVCNNLVDFTESCYITGDSSFKIINVDESDQYCSSNPIYLSKGEVVFTRRIPSYGSNTFCHRVNRQGQPVAAIDCDASVTEYRRYVIPEDGYYKFNLHKSVNPCVAYSISHLHDRIGELYMPNGVVGKPMPDTLIRKNLIKEIRSGYWNGAGLIVGSYYHSAPLFFEEGTTIYATNVASTYGSNSLLILTDREGTTLIKSYEPVETNDIYYTYKITKTGFYTLNIREYSCICTNVEYIKEPIGCYLPSDVRNVVDFLPEKGSTLSGKFISFSGDSICQGTANGGGYAKVIAELTKCRVENIGIGGGVITDEVYTSEGAKRFCISASVNNMSVDADYAIVEGGVNDSSLRVEKGTLSEGYDAELDTTTFYGAFEAMCKNLVTRFAGKKIGYIMVHKMTSQFDSSYEGNYYWIAKECLEKWGIPYLDLNTQCPPLNYVESLKNAYTSNGDGWHPNDEGYRKYYVPKIISWLESL